MERQWSGPTPCARCGRAGSRSRPGKTFYGKEALGFVGQVRMTRPGLHVVLATGFVWDRKAIASARLSPASRFRNNDCLVFEGNPVLRFCTRHQCSCPGGCWSRLEAARHTLPRAALAVRPRACHLKARSKHASPGGGGRSGRAFFRRSARAVT